MVEKLFFIYTSNREAACLGGGDEGPGQENAAHFDSAPENKDVSVNNKQHDELRAAPVLGAFLCSYLINVRFW